MSYSITKRYFLQQNISSETSPLTKCLQQIYTITSTLNIEHQVIKKSHCLSVPQKVCLTIVYIKIDHFTRS